MLKQEWNGNGRTQHLDRGCVSSGRHLPSKCHVLSPNPSAIKNKSINRELKNLLFFPDSQQKNWDFIPDSVTSKSLFLSFLLSETDKYRDAELCLIALSKKSQKRQQERHKMFFQSEQHWLYEKEILPKEGFSIPLRHMHICTPLSLKNICTVVARRDHMDAHILKVWF
jgi:hypothetical protein